jgi:hypothetical protein
MKKLIEEMDKSILCLAIELPESVHSDVYNKWEALKNAIIIQRGNEIESLKLVINMLKTESTAASIQVLEGMIKRLEKL